MKDAPTAAGKPLTQVAIPVENLDNFVAMVLANSGRVVEPKTPIPTIGWYATCAEPGGLLFGMLQIDPSAR